MGLVCFAGGDTSNQGKSREIKGNQGKSREIKGNQGKSREIKGNGRRRWRGVGPAGRPSPVLFGGSVILKI